MQSFKKTWEIYASSWKTGTEAERQALYEQSLEAGCLYQDPLARAEGWEQLSAYMREFQGQFPGASFRTTEFLTHNDQCIARWEMVGDGGKVLSTGTSHAIFAPSGKLSRMTGFFEVPSAEA